jgi:hypothetical protein
MYTRPSTSFTSTKVSPTTNHTLQRALVLDDGESYAQLLSLSSLTGLGERGAGSLLALTAGGRAPLRRTTCAISSGEPALVVLFSRLGSLSRLT